MEQPKLPNSTAALILGIISIVTCLCYGVLGLPLGIIAIVLGYKAKKIDQQDPGFYRGADSAQAGFIMGIIGTILNLLMLFFVVWVLTSLDWDAIHNEEDLRRALEELLGQ